MHLVIKNPHRLIFLIEYDSAEFTGSQEHTKIPNLTLPIKVTMAHRKFSTEHVEFEVGCGTQTTKRRVVLENRFHRFAFKVNNQPDKIIIRLQYIMGFRK